MCSLRAGESDDAAPALAVSSDARSFGGPPAAAQVGGVVPRVPRGGEGSEELLSPAAVARACAGRRVLVVDDNAFNLDVLEAFVKSAGCVVTTALDGVSALQLLEAAVAAEAAEAAVDADAGVGAEADAEAGGGASASPRRSPPTRARTASCSGFAAVLMDVQMPRMDGLECTRRMRALGCTNSSGWRMPVVGLTAYTGKDVHAACLRAGMDVVATKPVHCDALTQLLAKQLLAADYAAGASQRRDAASAVSALAVVWRDTVIDEQRS